MLSDDRGKPRVSLVVEGMIFCLTTAFTGSNRRALMELSWAIIMMRIGPARRSAVKQTFGVRPLSVAKAKGKDGDRL